MKPESVAVSAPASLFGEGDAAMGSGGTRRELQATLLHRSNRLRALHFNSPVLADSAMDLMLTLTVAAEQRRSVGEVALARINSLEPARAANLLVELESAGLATKERGVWSLSARGGDLMTAYLEAVAGQVAD